MKNLMKEFHLHTIKQASDHMICAAMAILFGTVPDADKIDEARALLGETTEHVWLLPALENSKSVKQTMASSVFATFNKTDRPASYHAMPSVFIREQGGLIGLQTLIKESTEQFKALLEKSEPLLEMLDRMERHMRAPSDPATDKRPSSEVPPDVVQAIKDAFAGKRNSVDLSDNVEMHVITLRPDGTLTGDVNNAPEEIKSIIRKIAAEHDIPLKADSTKH